MSWVKGQSGNPNGRPKKGKTLTDLIAKELEKKDVKTSDGKTISRKEAMIRVMTNQAVAGEYQFMKMVMEYVDGKPLQQIEADVFNSPTPIIEIVTEVDDDDEDDQE